MKKYILALDQGTTSSRAILFNKDQEIVSIAQTELTQIYPQAGWVEHDPMEIWATQSGVLNQVIAQAGIDAAEIDSIGITNQRETTIIWDKKTGKPIHNAIVWQCRRTADLADSLREQGYAELIQDKTGLIIDAYFSATKIKWILDHVEGAYDRARRGELMFGTVDTWLVYNLTNRHVHATDVTNAARTMLFNINECKWDDELCSLLDIPQALLPEVKNSSEIFGYASIQGVMIPIAGIAGDQQAALFGQTAFNPGEAKNTYGTGCFVLMNTGEKRVKSKNGLLTTIAIGIDNKIEYALEGSIFVGGAVVQWLRDEMGLIRNAAESEVLAQKVEDNGGVYVVPAFTGLGAPYWDMYARGSVSGLTRGSNRYHLIRASLEGVAYQTYDVLKAMESDSGHELTLLQVDGGASRNKFLMQFQADILGIPVRRPDTTETTALGAAYLAGLATGFFENKEALKKAQTKATEWQTHLSEEKREEYLKGWHRAVSRSFEWIEE